MRIIKYIIWAFLLAWFTSCGAKANPEYNDLVKNVYYKFVFAIDSDANDNPGDYFTDNALKKLQNDYEFDCDDGLCYAFYALRTNEHDSNPDSDGESRICCVEPAGNGWYVVSYSDMGWLGKTRVKIVDGKIDTYERIVQ